MTKNKILIAAGTFALAIAGFLSANANKKFAAATSAYFTVSSAVVTLFKGASTTNLTTVKSTNKTAFFATTAAKHKLFAVKSGTTLSKTAFLK